MIFEWLLLIILSSVLFYLKPRKKRKSVFTKLDAFRKQSMDFQSSFQPLFIPSTEQEEQIVDLILKYYIDSWYNGFLQLPEQEITLEHIIEPVDDNFEPWLFQKQLRFLLKFALFKIRIFYAGLDLTDLLLTHICPILTHHLYFYKKSMFQIRQNRLSLQADQLDYQLAQQYHSQTRLHSAISGNRYKLPTYTQATEYLWMKRNISAYVKKFYALPLPPLLHSLCTDLVVKFILMPLNQNFSDPDFYNLTMDWFLSQLMTEQRMVKQLRQVLDLQVDSTSKKIPEIEVVEATPVKEKRNSITENEADSADEVKPETKKEKNSVPPLFNHSAATSTTSLALSPVETTSVSPKIPFEVAMKKIMVHQQLLKDTSSKDNLKVNENEGTSSETSDMEAEEEKEDEQEEEVEEKQSKSVKLAFLETNLKRLYQQRNTLMQFNEKLSLQLNNSSNRTLFTVLEEEKRRELMIMQKTLVDLQKEISLLIQEKKKLEEQKVTKRFSEADVLNTSFVLPAAAGQSPTSPNTSPLPLTLNTAEKPKPKQLKHIEIAGWQYSENEKFYVSYQIKFIDIDDQTNWSGKRYSEFHQLYGQLKTQFSQTIKPFPAFPGKRLMRKFKKSMSKSWDEGLMTTMLDQDEMEFIESRRLALEKFLKAVLELPLLSQSLIFQQFLYSSLQTTPKLTASNLKDAVVGGVTRLLGVNKSTSDSVLNDPTSPTAAPLSPPSVPIAVSRPISAPIKSNPVINLAKSFGSSLSRFQFSPQPSVSVPSSPVKKPQLSVDGQTFYTSSGQETPISIHQMIEQQIEESLTTPMPSPIEDMRPTTTIQKQPMRKFSRFLPFFLELFELSSRQNWLRRQALVILMEQVLAGMMERRLRDGLSQYKGENGWSQLCATTLTILNRPEVPPLRSKEEKEKTRLKVERKLMFLMPDLVGAMVGKKNAKRGAQCILEMVQNTRMNQELVYRILDILLISLQSVSE